MPSSGQLSKKSLLVFRNGCRRCMTPTTVEVKPANWSAKTRKDRSSVRFVGFGKGLMAFSLLGLAFIPSFPTTYPANGTASWARCNFPGFKVILALQNRARNLKHCVTWCLGRNHATRRHAQFFPSWECWQKRRLIRPIFSSPADMRLIGARRMLGLVILLKVIQDSFH